MANDGDEFQGDFYFDPNDGGIVDITVFENETHESPILFDANGEMICLQPKRRIGFTERY